MPQPTKLASLDLKIDTYVPSLLVQIAVGNFVGPEDVADPLQTPIVKSIDFVYVPFDNSPATENITKNKLYTPRRCCVNKIQNKNIISLARSLELPTPPLTKHN